MKNIGIIGVGKLGLCYALIFEKAGCQVWASSYKQDYIKNLNLKITDSTEPGVATMLASSKNILFTSDNHQVIDHCDIIYVMVATPSLELGNYDVTAIQHVVTDFLNHPDSVENKILVIGSTVNPGDCETFQEQLNDRKVHVVYFPTLVAQGSVLQDINNPIALSLGTLNDEIAQRVRTDFSAIIPNSVPIYQVSPTTAEILKIAGNCYSILRINFFNILGRILLTAGLEQDMANANWYMKNVETGKIKCKFGFGYGGPCYPRDNRSFQHYTDSIGVPNLFSVINDKINHDHSDFLTTWLLKNNTIPAKPYYFEYVSYKPGVKIFEESQPLVICERLLKAGHQVIIAPSEFLDHKIVKSLQDRFPEQVRVKLSTELEQSGIDFYPVSFTT